MMFLQYKISTNKSENRKFWVLEGFLCYYSFLALLQPKKVLTVVLAIVSA